MHHVYSSAASLPQYLFAVKEKLISQLTPKQKIILVISSLAISLFAAILITYRCCRTTSFGSPHVGGGYRRNPSPPPSPTPIYHPPQPQFNAFPSPKPPTPYIPPYQSPQLPLKAFPSPQPLPLGNPWIDPVQEPEAGEDLTPRLDLSTIEENILCLREDLTVEHQILASLMDSKSSKTPLFVNDEKEENALFLDDNGEEVNPLLQSNDEIQRVENRISELQQKLKDCLADYPKILRDYLEGKFKNYRDKDAHDIYWQLVMLSGCMQKNATDEDFIHSSLEQVNLFLTHSFFTSTTELCLQEESKINLLVFHELFSIVATHFDLIERRDPKLATELKLKLANLPVREGIDRTKFSKAFLTEKNQLDILVSHFQSEEDRLLTSILQTLQKETLSANDINKLSKMAMDSRSDLSQANRLKLQAALTTQMGHQAPTNWSDYQTVESSVNQFYRENSFGCFPESDSVAILNLHRASKAKEFFEHQVGLREDQIQIPRWYHATSSMLDIIQSGQVNVEHRKAFKGAWVSTQREADFGTSVLVFNHRLANLDPKVFIGYEKGKVRWRGLQCPIPVIPSANDPFLLALVGYRSRDKMLKVNVVNSLQAKGINTVVVSVDQVEYIQREIIKILGNPNLTDQWWGKGDFRHLEMPIPQTKL